MDIDLKLETELWDVAVALADLSDPIALKYFRKPKQGLKNKLEIGFDPVTQADYEIEESMRKYLAKLRPLDGILGEEFDDVQTQSGLTWVLDPIDGTKSFISGTPTWGILIALNDGEKPILGLIDQPFTGERFFGGLSRSYLEHNRNKTIFKARETRDLSDCILYSTMPKIGSECEVNAFDRVSDQCKLTRFGTDCYAYGLLALGQIDLVIEAGLNPYDIQAPIGVVQASGGIVTDWQGKSAQNGGRVIAAANLEIHTQALDILSKV